MWRGQLPLKDVPSSCIGYFNIAGLPVVWISFKYQYKCKACATHPYPPFDGTDPFPGMLGCTLKIFAFVTSLKCSSQKRPFPYHANLKPSSYFEIIIYVNSLKKSLWMQHLFYSKTLSPQIEIQLLN